VAIELEQMSRCHSGISDFGRPDSDNNATLAALVILAHPVSDIRVTLRCQRCNQTLRFPWIVTCQLGCFQFEQSPPAEYQT